MKVAIFGIGNYAEVIIELCLDLNYSIVSLYHFNSERNGEKVMGYSIIGCYEDFIRENKEDIAVVVAIGDNKLRNELLNKFRNLGFNTLNLIHPSAYISKSAKIGFGVYIHANSFVWTQSIISNNVILSPFAMVAHHTFIGEGVSISANAMVGSYVEINERVMVGINAGIISKKIIIGCDSIIGASSIVLNSIEPKTVVVGNPAKQIINREQ